MAIGIARLLGKESFGQLAILQSTVGLFGTVAALGLGNTVLKHVAQHRSTDRARAGRIIVLGTVIVIGSAVIVATVLFLMAGVLASHALHLPQLTLAVRLISLSLILNAMESVQTGTLFGLEAFSIIAKNTLGRSVLTLVLVLAGAWQWGLLGAISGQIVGDLVYNCYTWVVVSRVSHEHSIPLTMRFDRRDFPIIWNFSLPLLLTSIAGWAAQWTAGTLLIQQPGGSAQMALFQAGRQWTTPMGLIPGAMGEVGLPMLSHQIGAGNLAAFTRTLLLQLRVSTVTCVVIGGVLGTLSPLIMSVYGRDYREGWPIVVIMSFAMALNIINGICNQVVASLGKMWSGFVFTLGFGVTLALSARLWVSNGAFGLACAFLLAYLVHTLLQCTFSLLLLRRLNTHKRDLAAASVA